MKKFVLTLALLVSSVSFAQSTTVSLASGDMSVRLLSSAKVVGTKAVFRLCPPRAMCAPMFKMTLALTLGCTNKLGPVTGTAVYNERDAKYDLFLTATEIVSKSSLTARCVAANVKTVEMVVPGGMDKSNTNVVMSTQLLNDNESAGGIQQ